MSEQQLEFMICEGNTMTEKYNTQSENYVNKQDSGFDVYYPETFTINPGETKVVSLKIKARVVCKNSKKTKPYWLVPRSSIFKTKLRMANSVGIIDLNYRGQLGTPLDNIGLEPTTIEAGTRLFQICSHDLIPFSSIKKVYSLDETQRGSGGFGSTGRN